MAEPEPKKPDEIERLLKAAVHRRRPWTFRAAVITVALLVLPVALFVWWVWPRREEPQLVVVAFDQATVPGAALKLRAQLEALGEDSDAADLAGRDVYFEETRMPGLP